MAFNILNFKEQGLKFGGARPGLFQVELFAPFLNNASTSKFTFTCKGASLPAATVGSIDVGYFGRKIKISGDRTFSDWSVSVFNDEDFLARSMFEQWSSYLNTMITNVRELPEGLYKADMTVKQFGKQGDILREYVVVGAFPTSVDAINLNWDTQNQIEEFNVSLAYDYWYVAPVASSPLAAAGATNSVLV